MAKSPVGGSRAYLKGRIGSDVYSLGKDGKGRRQQIVRALPEAVTNPRTSSQMFGRMIMTTIAAAVHDLAPIIDHSFDGIPKGQPSISEFTRLNYALIKADAIANPSSGNTFGLLQYGEREARMGRYVISKGKAKFPSSWPVLDAGALDFDLGSGNMTVGAFKAAWGLGSDEYVTLISYQRINQLGDRVGFKFGRFSFDFKVADTTALTSDVMAAALVTEGSVVPSITVSGGLVTIELPAIDGGIIITRKVAGKFIHSNCTLAVGAGLRYAADAALPTYPIGTEEFLNGGDL